MLMLMTISLWTVGELALHSAREYANPLWDAVVTVTLTAPSGRQHTVEGFWDGGDTWRVRFSPDEVGLWRWRTECSDAADEGLHGREGEFQCVPYEGDNPLFTHGAVRLSEDRRRFVHADGTPFFWLADTAWNGVLKAREEDWQRYLDTRRGQRFTAIQFVSTQWRAYSVPADGEPAYTEGERVGVNPEFFQRRDPLVAAINERGMVAAPIILWAIGKGDPGFDLPEEDAIRLARYIVARWGAHQVVWMLGGDGNYRAERADKWKRIGRAVFADRRDRLVTMHPGGLHWIADEFREEPWFDFLGYQSGHGDSPEHVRWLASGPPAQEWGKAPPRPIINLEPNYETHPSYHSKQRFGDREVRRAAWWSLLIAPTAGVSYGHNSIWPWGAQREVPRGHAGIGEVEPWTAGLEPPGARSMAVMRGILDGLPWWRLRPAPELITAQPGEADPTRHIAAAMTDEGDCAAIYLPVGGAVTLRMETLERPLAGRWVDPRGEMHELDAGEGPGFDAPDDGDWLLVLE